MIKPINPYNVVAVYNTDCAESLLGHINSPLTKLPPFQFEIPYAESLDSWYLVDTETQSNVLQPNSLVTTNTFTTAIKKFLTYKGGFLNPEMTQGCYRAKFILTNGAAYWSHKFCLAEYFTGRIETISAFIPVCTGGSNFAFAITVLTGGATVRATVAAAAGFVYKASGNTPELNFVINSSDFSGTGSLLATIKLEAYFEDHYVEKRYNLTFNTSDPCDYTFQQSLQDIRIADGAMYVEFWHDMDMQERNLVYQNEYKQRFYFRGFQLDNTPIVEDNFRRNGKGELTLTNQSTAEEIAWDFFPCPKYLPSVLSSLTPYHHKQVVHLGGTETPVDRVAFAAENIESEDASKGRLTFEINNAFVAACEDNFA